MPSPIDPFSRHAHYLEQYFNGESDKINAFLRRIARHLRLELTKTQTVISQRRINALLDFTEQLVNNELKDFTGELAEQIELFAVSESEFAMGTLQQIKDYDFTLPAPGQLRAAVYARPFNNSLLKDYLSEFSKTQARMVRDAVSMGFYEGKTTQQIVQGIIGTKSQQYKNGILNVARTSGERMVRNALSHTSNVARATFFDDNIDLVPFYEWVSTLDGRTSPICRSLDGKVFKTNKGRLPPAHHNCRSTTSPLFAEDVDSKGNKLAIGGKRASMNGQVSADLSYNDWLKGQSKEFQYDLLGSTKAKLFREGGFTMDKFVNNRGQSLTLDQLKTKYPIVWGNLIGD